MNSQVSPPKLIASSCDKKRSKKSKSKHKNKNSNENIQLNLREFIADNKKLYLKMNVFDNASNCLNRDRNGLSRSKSPVDSTNFNSTFNGINLKTSHDNINYKKTKSNKKTISDIPNTNILTESINKKSKDLLSSSPVYNKNIMKACEKKQATTSKFANNNLTKRTNGINNMNFFKKNSSNIISEFKKDTNSNNFKVIIL